MRRIVIVAFPGFQTLDVVGPAEVFSIADRIANGDRYRVEVVASSAATITTGSGLLMAPHRSLAGIRGPIDTLVVDAVATMCGFGTVETLRRAFQRHFGVNPAAYRSRFRTRGGSHADRHTAV